MVAEIHISMDMITCFKSCVRQQNYKPFFDNYRSYLNKSLDFIDSVYFENADTIFIAQNLRSILRYLENFDWRYPGSFVEGSYGLSSSDIYEDMKAAILKMNWDPFYSKYIHTIDFMIEEARRQQIIQICIEYDGCCYPNFESRSTSPNFNSTSTISTGILRTSAPRLYDNSKRGHPYEVKNSREMLVTNTQPTIFTISNSQNISPLRDRYLPPDISHHNRTHPVSSFAKNDYINERGTFHSSSRESTGQILSFSSLNEPCCDRNKQQSNHWKQTTELSLGQPGASGYSSNCRAFYSTKPPFASCTFSECHSKSMSSTNCNGCESISRKVGNPPCGDNTQDKEIRLTSRSECSSTRKETNRLEHDEISPNNQANFTMVSGTTPQVGYQNPVSLKTDYLNNDHNSTQNQSEFDVIQGKSSMAEEQKTTTQDLETIGSIENGTAPEQIEHLDSMSGSLKNEQFSPAGLLCKPESSIRLHSETGGKDDHLKQITKDSTPQNAFEGAELIKLPLEQSEMVLENSGESPNPVLDYLSHNDGFSMITGAHPSNGFPNESAYEEHNLSHFEHSESLLKEEQLLPNHDSEHFHDKLFDSLRRHSLTEKQNPETLYDNDFFSYKMEIQNASEIERGNEIWEATRSTENDTSHILGDASFHAEPEEDNSSFIRFFEELKSKQREELEEKRRERSKKQQNLEDEVRKLREESKKRFLILMNCIVLRRRFEEQEDNWKIWIQNCRNHIVSLHRFFSIFEQDYGTILRNSKKLDTDDLKDLQSEKLRVSSFVFKTFYELEEDFEQLKELEHHCQEVLFLRILQKCVTDVANKLLEIIEFLVQQEVGRDIFMRLEESIANLIMTSQSAFQLEEHDYKSIGHLITKMVFIFFNNTNKCIGTDKVKMSDFRNLNDKNWEVFYNQHEQFFKLVCSEILENGYIFVTNEKHNISELPVSKELQSPNNTTQQDLDGKPVDNKHEMSASIKQEEEVDEDFELLEMEELDKSPQNLEEATNESCEEVPIEVHISPASNTSPDSGAFFLDALDSLKKKESTDDGPKFKKPKYDFSDTLTMEIDQVCNELDKSQQQIREDLDLRVENNVWMKSSKSCPTEPENMESVEIDSEFKKKENEQKRRNEKKLKEARRKRKQKEKEHRKELEEMCRQQKLCFATLLKCIQLRNRFEEKELEVSDWIKKCYKQPVSSFIRRFLDFESFANQLKQFKKIPQESLEDVTQETLNLNKSASRLIDSLENSFNKLEDLIQINSDAKFVRILQRSIVNHVIILHRVMDKLEEGHLTNFWYSELENVYIQFQSVIIPSTEMLRETCKNDFCPEWKNMEFPKREMKNSVHIEELVENS